MSDQNESNANNSDYFRLLRKIIVLSGFNSLWYRESWSGKMIQLYCRIAAAIFFVKITLLNLYSIEVFRDIKRNWREIAFFLASTLTIDTTIQKFFILRTDAMQKLFREAFALDNWIRRTPHEGIRKALKPLRDEVYKISIILVLLFFTCFVCFCGAAIYFYMVGRACDLTDEQRNCERILPWATMNFLNMETQFGMSMLLHAIGISYIEFYVVAANIARFAVCVFPTFRLRRLNHVLENFDHYSRLLCEKEKISIRDGEYYVVRECIIEHQKIISDFTHLKANTKVLFFMDFLTMAIQLAPYPVIIMGTKNIDHIYFFAVTCLIFAFSDLLMIYWFAHYIVEESKAVQSSVFSSNWQEADIRTKKMLLLIMIRSNRRLVLKVGPLYEMDLNIFLRIVKGMYTMITVFRQGTVNL
ncbi:uncharacterized protein LOC123318916 [Coccinella septempunctata]|uniref:uncharacterized protein LOC123318916 n=1 Tax=Coccinella septempunctata TaxID=41139 RepID=UPI001D06D4F0|nr:uncharacterized protein LOC123318916 [Coccinella septempunctata]